jgi:hypothetical protein
MTDDELAMAYADGELDPIAARRFEQRMATEPALAEAVEAHHALRAQLQGGFAAVSEEPVPDRLAAMLKSNVVAFRPRERVEPQRRRAGATAAVAACLVVALAAIHFWPSGPVTFADGQVLASGPLAAALDRQLSAEPGDTRVLLSFQEPGGTYCRVFADTSVSGIACREGGGWVLRRTQPAQAAPKAGEYRQAGSADAGLLAEAQELMAGEPLTPDAERLARDRHWR